MASKEVDHPVPDTIQVPRCCPICGVVNPASVYRVAGALPLFNHVHLSDGNRVIVHTVSWTHRSTWPKPSLEAWYKLRATFWKPPQ